MSQVSVCNQALGQLGAETITQVGQDSVEGRLCDAFYFPILNAVLNEHPWTFALEKFRITPVDDEPVFFYEQKFLLPGRILRVLHVRNDDRSDMWTQNTLRWERIGEFIEANSEFIFVMAIVKVTDDSKFDPMFVQAFVARLASEMAVPLTNSRSLKESFLGIYQALLSEAASADGQQGRNKVIRSNHLTGVRRSGFGTTGVSGGFATGFV